VKKRRTDLKRATEAAETSILYLPLMGAPLARSTNALGAIIEPLVAP
jgi:hypothetical protein